jgi:hypothetical protein
MTWSYTTADLGTNAKDQVPFPIGDTLSTDPQPRDEKITIQHVMLVRGLRGRRQLDRLAVTALQCDGVHPHFASTCGFLPQAS